MKIHTNNHKYDVICWQELTKKERTEFDWILESSTLTTDDAEFVRYRGNAYCLSDFMRVKQGDTDFKGWDGYQSDSFFSGIVLKYPREEWGEIDTEHVIIGYYL